MVGSAIALGLTATRRRPSIRISSYFAAAGAVTIAGSLTIIGAQSEFPGPLTVFPVLGTALLIVGGVNLTRISKALSVAPLTRIGDWSYSIYLWHWPMVVYASHYWPTEDWIIIAAGFGAIGPALLSYHFVEKPLRNREFPNRASFARFAAITIGGALALSVGVAATAAFYWQPKVSSGSISVRFQGDLYTDYWREVKGVPGIDHFDCDAAELFVQVSSDYSSLPCAQSTSAPEVRIAVLGDSHAAHLYDGLRNSLPGTGVAYFALASQAPIQDQSTMTALISHLANHPTITNVIVTARWPFYDQLSKSEMTETIRTLAAGNKEVLLTDGVPTFSFGPEQCKYERILLWKSGCTEAKVVDSQGHEKVAAMLQSVASETSSVNFAETFTYFCDKSTCSMTDGALLLWGDSDHLNAQGSRYLAERLLAENREFFEKTPQSNKKTAPSNDPN